MMNGMTVREIVRNEAPTMAETWYASTPTGNRIESPIVLVKTKIERVMRCRASMERDGGHEVRCDDELE